MNGWMDRWMDGWQIIRIYVFFSFCMMMKLSRKKDGKEVEGALVIVLKKKLV